MANPGVIDRTRKLTYAEYVELERNGEGLHEFVRGEMYEMPGASHPHNIVAANAIAAVGIALRDAPYLAYASQMRVKTGDETGTYPDVSVSSDAPVVSDDYDDELLNPIVVVEVLSESTEAYDRGEKFEHYQTIESLRHYVLIDPRRVHVEVFTRDGGAWRLHSCGRGGTVELDAIGVTLPVDDLYRKVPGLV